MFGFGAVGEFLRFLREQRGGTLVLEFTFHPAANFVEGRRRRRFDVEHLENDLALWNLGRIDLVLVALVEYRVHQSGRGPQARQDVGSADVVGRHRLQIF